MGACASKPQGGFVGVKSKLKRRRNRKSRRMKKHGNRVEPANQIEISYNNPAFQGYVWFEPEAVLDSDGEDEFYSVQDDASLAGSISAGVTPRFSSHSIFSNGIDFQLNYDDLQNEVKDQSILEKSSVQCVCEVAGRDKTGILQSCGFLSNALIPCLPHAESTDCKRKSNNPGGPSTRKRLSFVPSFKWREGQDTPILSSIKAVMQRPIAGSQIMCSPLEKKISECWSHVAPDTFKVRGQNYNRDKKKEFAPNYAAYVPFGVDVFLSPRKIDHIARFIELPVVDSYEEVPPILVVNLQIPLYPAAIFQNEYDGAGMSFVFYFKLSENYSKNLPDHFRENFKRIIDNETEKIKGFPMDTNASFRERLKILGRVVNLDELQLSAAERKLMHNYNENPVLSRPQHEFYFGENYFEIDLDIHRFSYIARKGFETFQDRIKNCVFDFGLTIQGNKAEDLPECMLCCIRLKEIDYNNYSQLGF
ncbi:hypothetical protein BUALT_Bualt16G0010500 [Buddleja alternifolia]|uniref:Protein ENHANCED DISEASE RESISTANCE 2 C-terminal domain-containing protein n=1 Tax=Buddleja alternifolia TaxID=168488 RepID=A0AAV6W8P7_9LAMI|nr:hypothetical protein BUALT_Bualt16G0010500 [Buddleja alternifolia]